jgi:hypothetical protein
VRNHDCIHATYGQPRKVTGCQKPKLRLWGYLNASK